MRAPRAVAFSVLAGGVFNSGVLARPVPGATYDYAPAPAAVLDRARRIAAVCARHQVAIGAVALQFVLAHPAVTAAVVGARSPAEMTQDAGFLAAAVPGAVFADLAAEGLLPTGAPGGGGSLGPVMGDGPAA